MFKFLDDYYCEIQDFWDYLGDYSFKIITVLVVFLGINVLLLGCVLIIFFWWKVLTGNLT